MERYSRRLRLQMVGIGDDDLKLSVAKQSDTTDLYQTTLPPLTCRTKTQQRQSLGLL